MVVKKVVKKVVKGKPGVAAKSAKTTANPGAALTPIQKMQLARKNGTGKKKPVKRSPIPVFKAPEDFKPHFLEIFVRTEKDGLLGSSIKATRYQGRYDPDAEDKKKADLGSYDTPTLIGIQARLAAVIYKATNDKKYSVSPKDRADEKGAMRMPASTVFRILIRVNRKAADGTLSVLFKQMWQQGKNAKGRVIYKELLKADPAWRGFRKATRLLPAAFRAVQSPPKRTRGGAKRADDADE